MHAFSQVTKKAPEELGLHFLSTMAISFPPYGPFPLQTLFLPCCDER